MKLLFTPRFLDCKENKFSLFESYPAAYIPASKKDLQNLFCFGGNRGNLFCFEAPQLILNKYDNDMVSADIAPEMADKINSTFDAVIISFTDIIRKNHNLAEIYSILEKIKIPIFALGIGLAHLVNISEVHSSIRRVLELLQKKAELFAVLGHDTEKWCHSNGFTRAVALGCPSFYIFPDKFSQALSLLHEALQMEMSAIATAGHFSRVNKVINPRGRRLLSKLNFAKRIDLVFQDEIFSYLHENDNVYDFTTGSLERKYFDSALEQYGFETGNVNYYYFNNPNTWRLFLSFHDCFLGERLHGGVAALQMGIPAYIFSGDIRAAELMDMMMLPVLKIEECENGMMEYLKNKYSHFDRNRIVDNYFTLLNRFNDEFTSKFIPGPGKTSPIKEASVCKAAPDDIQILQSQIQKSNTTFYDRYPQIFSFLSNVNEKNILSVGCSVGEECFCLCSDYVHNCTVVGYDICIDNINEAQARKEKFKSGNNLLFCSKLDLHKYKNYFDYVLALSVLCVWPDTKNMKNISAVFPYQKAQTFFQDIDKVLRVGGYFILYNCNYTFEYSDMFYKYMKIPSAIDSGFVKRFFNDGNEDTTNSKYTIIFKKVKD